jgi:hypothetical protein
MEGWRERGRKGEGGRERERERQREREGGGGATRYQPSAANGSAAMNQRELRWQEIPGASRASWLQAVSSRIET